MKIGFFGDSFCSCVTHPAYSFTPYIKLLQDHYQAEIVNLGHGGSSIWDLILNQLTPFVNSNTIPDICVFVWTEPHRLFHKQIRHISSSAAVNSKESDPVWRAAKEYYMNLEDSDLDELRYRATLHYVDNVILPAFPSTTKIVHLWSFGLPQNYNYRDPASFSPESVQYYHTWKTGVEIRPPMITLAVEGLKIEDLDDRPNHLIGQEKNDRMFEIIKHAIDSQ